MRRAFTIIELLTIVVILGIIAGVTLPRLVDRDRRAVQRELLSVRDLLSTAAAREETTSAPIALAYDERTLRLLSLRAPEALTPWSGEGTWADDPLATPVRLDRLELVSATAAGQALDRNEWRVGLHALEARPSVALALSDGRGSTWLVWLAPDAMRARSAPLTDATRAEELEGPSVDLDLTGQEEVPW